VPVYGRVTLSIASGDTLDSAALYYKEATANVWLSAQQRARAPAYDFTVQPPADGALLQYYYTAHRNNDVYGYDRETRYAWVAADTGLLTRFEIVPFTGDTLNIPASSAITFAFKGYYSTSFIPAVSIDSSAVTWHLSNAQGCVLETSHGLRALVRTASSRMSTPAVVSVTIDTTKIRLKAGISPVIAVKIFVPGSPLAAITVKRVDAKNPLPISTSLADRAAFLATGIDKENNVLCISPAWSVLPSAAGTIAVDGTFRPGRHFVGMARIIATQGVVSGEYACGLNVRHLISRSDTSDTATNGGGVSVVFPPDIVTGTDQGMLELSVSNTQNLMKKGFVTNRMADSCAYEISELSNVAFNFSSDSIRLILAVPANAVRDAASGKKKYYIARWSQDSLMWDRCANSSVAPDGRSVSAPAAHFSSYAVVTQPSGLTVDFSIHPNAFSPKVRPLGATMPLGTCIAVTPDMPEGRLQQVDVAIYNLLGDRVWAVQIQNAMAAAYSIWWDGTTTDRIVGWPDANRTTVTIQGRTMCRNGRYFVVVTVKDYHNKEIRLMKPVVLMK
jgi:hypothetical protein